MSDSAASPKKKLPQLMSLADWEIKVEAARLRVTTDRKLKKTTPAWVHALATLDLSTSADETSRLAYKAQVEAAQQRIVADREAGRLTPPWILAVAQLDVGE